MEKKYKSGDAIYSDFEGDNEGPKEKLIYCENCERWIPPPYIHTCYNAKAARESERKHKEGRE